MQNLDDTLSFKVATYDAKVIRAAARAKGVSTSEFIRSIIVDWLNHRSDPGRCAIDDFFKKDAA